MKTREYLATYRRGMEQIEKYLSALPEECVTPNVFHAWELGGLFTPTWSRDGEITRLWLNVIAHQAAVGLLTYGIGSKLQPHLEREGVSLPLLTQAALIHDWFKRREQEYKDEASDRGLNMAAANQQAELSSVSGLEKAGFSSEIVRLSKTGDTGMERARSGRATLAENIVFYADCCVSNDKVVTYKQRFDDVLVHFQPGGRYDWVDADYQRQYGKTHRQIWDSVVLPLQEDLATLLGFKKNPMEIPFCHSPEFVHGE